MYVLENKMVDYISKTVHTFEALKGIVNEF